MTSSPAPRAADLTAVVLSWNTRETTLDALRAIPGAAAPYRALRICVDNASADGSAAAARAAFPDALVVENAENLGYAAGNDAALPHLRGRAVVFLNSDTAASPGSLAALLRYLDEHPRVGIVSPRLVAADGTPRRAAWGFPSMASLVHEYTPLGWLGVGAAASKRARGRRDANETTGPVDAVAGACLAIRRDLCERLGGFDAGYPFYFEDTDLCRRARDAGYEVHVAVDGPPVVHHGGIATRPAQRQMRLRLFQGALRFLRKNSARAAFGAFAPLFKAGVVARSLWEIARTPVFVASRRLRGKAERGARTLEMARARVHFLERDLLPFLRSWGEPRRMSGPRLG